MDRDITLAIETGISYGSLSILKDGAEIDFLIGKGEVPSSEELLSNIKYLFAKNNLRKSQTKRIVVSTGPGSFTGVRVGVATATGLSRALGCEFLGIPVLEAFALRSQVTGSVIAGFGIGEHEVCWQAFRMTGAKVIQRSNPKSDSIQEFENQVRNSSLVKVILTEDLSGKVAKNFYDFVLVEVVGNPAKYVGLASEEITLSSSLLPLYARDGRIS